MQLTFLAVVLVMVLLIGFVLIILHSLAVSAGIRIRADMVKLLSSYDRIIESKSRQIKQLQEELEQLPAATGQMAAEPPKKETEQGLSAPSVPETADYRHTDLGGSYGVIRDHFFLTEDDRQALAEQVRQENGGSMRGEAAAALWQSLSYDTVFRMAQLDPEEQLRLLDTSLDDQDWSLLRDFWEEQPVGTPFSITRFCDWLEEISALESNELEIRGSNGAPADGKPRICEGVQILVGSKLYDYSINEREIS